MTDLMTTISAALTRRGFTVHHAATKEEAARLVLSLIPEGASVGAGGSMTIRELALAESRSPARRRTCRPLALAGGGRHCLP